MSPLNIANVTTTHFATLLFTRLLSSSSRCKTLARSIKPSPSLPASTPSQGHFFVPADGGAPPPSSPEPDDEDAPQSLIPLLSENLSLCFLSKSRVDPANENEAREWERLIVGYLCLLVQWLWEDPKAVREYLEAGGLGVLVEPINQTAEGESLIPGLCAFLLGVCYEFNREPGEITRSTIHPIITRLGVDAVIGQMTRFREDDRFKSITPESIILSCPTPGGPPPSANQNQNQNPAEQEGELWFDWAFVDFWKSNHYTVQRGLSTDPNASSSSSSSSGPSAESAMLISSLRDVIRTQAQELDTLQAKLKELSTSSASQIKDLETHVADLVSSLQDSEDKKKDVEKEQEDLLVLLDDMNTKRRRDKERMREAGLEVSEDEEDEDIDEDEDEE